MVFRQLFLPERLPLYPANAKRWRNCLANNFSQPYMLQSSMQIKCPWFWEFYSDIRIHPNMNLYLHFHHLHSIPRSVFRLRGEDVRLFDLWWVCAVCIYGFENTLWYGIHDNCTHGIDERDVGTRHRTLQLLVKLCLQLFFKFLFMTSTGNELSRVLGTSHCNNCNDCYNKYFANHTLRIITVFWNSSDLSDIFLWMSDKKKC